MQYIYFLIFFCFFSNLYGAVQLSDEELKLTYQGCELVIQHVPPWARKVEKAATSENILYDLIQLSSSPFARFLMCKAIPHLSS